MTEKMETLGVSSISDPDSGIKDQIPTDYKSPFYIGHHESKRTQPVTDAFLRQSHTAGYDMLTIPVTTQHFQERVLALVKAYFLKLSGETQRDELTMEITPIPIIPPLTPVDTYLGPGDTVSQAIAYASPWIDLDSADPLISNISQQVLNIEIAYASFCGIGHLLMSGPKSTRLSPSELDRLTQYARAVKEALVISNFIQISIYIPMYIDENYQNNTNDLSSYARSQFTSGKICKTGENGLYESWDLWNSIRSICKYNSRLLVALEVPQRLPIGSLQSRWYAEPLRMLCFPATTFLLNNARYPVLSKAHQNLITRYMRLKLFPWILLCDVGPIPEPDTHNRMIEPTSEQFPSLKTVEKTSYSESCLRAETRDPLITKISDQKAVFQNPLSHLLYLRHLQKNQPARTATEVFGSGYQDYLQIPLQPLTDNLESVTYEVFEKDPVKYDLYEKAISWALSSWSTESKPTSSKDGSVVIAVAGSGRGPLVTRALKASKASGVPVELWAVEKNPNAYVLLQRINKEQWGGVVNVVKSDMRAWKGPVRKDIYEINSNALGSAKDSTDVTYGHVDILVSELLGSFGDNELSPECLDGVQHVLAPEYGISIPSSYTAHLTPISAPRLHADISRRVLMDDTATETPYVVMLNAIDFLASNAPDHHRIQKAWEFVHPIPRRILAMSSARRSGGVSGGGGGSMCGGDGANEHNVRAAHLKFICKDRGIMHGIAGYFEAVLYDSGINGKIELSTRPDTIDMKSKDMISWFPIYFPLKNPLYFPDDSELKVSIWRQTDDRKVWYEWLVEAFVVIGPDHRLRLGMSDLCSSRKSGCLM